MALGYRGAGADVELIHHSDRGSQLGLNPSSQQCVGERDCTDGRRRLRVGRAAETCLGDAAVVAEARPEGVPERR